MNIQYVKPAAQIMVWGVLLLIGGGAMSGYLSSMAIAEEISSAMSPFGVSDADSYFGGAALFGLASLLGFILMLVGISRMVSRIDQRYDAWFSCGQQMAYPQQGIPAHSHTQQGQHGHQAQHPGQAQQPQPMQPQQYRPGPPPPQQPPQSGPRS